MNNRAVVVRIHGDKMMGNAIGDTLIAKELERTQTELKRAREELELIKLIHAQEDAHKLNMVRRQHKRKRSLLWRIEESCAFAILGMQLIGEAIFCK